MMWILVVVLPIFVLNASWLISTKSVFSCETEIKMNQWWNVKRLKWINCHKHTQHTGKSENGSTRCASVWKIVCGRRFGVVEVCTLPRVCVMCLCAYEENQFNTNQMPHCRTRVCMPKNTPIQLTCGSPAVLPTHTHIDSICTANKLTLSHTQTFKQPKQSSDEQNEYIGTHLPYRRAAIEWIIF